MNSIKISRTLNHNYFRHPSYQSTVMKKIIYNYDIMYITLKEIKSDLMDMGIGY